jgi:uncharacterized protein YdeI (YjbR/CyaY-like superfamily)
VHASGHRPTRPPAPAGTQDSFHFAPGVRGPGRRNATIWTGLGQPASSKCVAPGGSYFAAGASPQDAGPLCLATAASGQLPTKIVGPHPLRYRDGQAKPLASDHQRSWRANMPIPRELLTFRDRTEWRNWLEAHHQSADEAWLLLHKKGVRQATLSLDEAVREALCFGWIDGKLRSLDKERYSLRFTPRRPDSVWSINNVRRVKELISEGLMTDAGLRKVAEACQSGQWEAAKRREQVDRIPPDLEKALRRRKGASARYRDRPASRRKQLLHWLMTSKTPQTRQKRIEAIVEEVAQ